MNWWHFFFLCTYFSSILANAAVVPDTEDVAHQGLYSKSDHVTILTNNNFDKKIYGQRNAILIQFYNSYCGHCRAFAPKFKSLASELVAWKRIIQLAVLDCSVEENNEICRQFEVMAYPSLRYLHEFYVKGNANVGDKFSSTDSVENLKAQLIKKMQNEQSLRRLSFAPPLNIASYANFNSALSPITKDVMYTFIIFENENSTVGSELAIDTHDYQNIRVKRAYETSELAEIAGVKQFPAVVAVGPNMESSLITSQHPTAQNLLQLINTFLKSRNYVFPKQNIKNEESMVTYYAEMQGVESDVLYYGDLEKTLKTSLHTEITRHKVLNGEPLQVLLDYLDIIILAFPFRGNVKEFVVDLRKQLATKSQWSGSEIYDLVKSLESVHAPVFLSDIDYVKCKGSAPVYRGYTCGLWTLFHTLTVNAAVHAGNQGPKVLQTMHGYVKHFFGCSDCSNHFQEMAAKNRIFDVKENDKAVLWLWIAHNEVNLRLAGDATEDPKHPKIQFPSTTRCPECRLSRGAWNLPAVYEYLRNIYSAANVQAGPAPGAARAATPPSPFSNLDLGLLSFLYIFSFIILILLIKYFISRHLLRKRRYKQAWGKV